MQSIKGLLIISALMLAVPAKANTFNVDGTFNSTLYRITSTIDQVTNGSPNVPFMDATGTPFAGFGNPLVGTVNISNGVLTGVNLSAGILATFNMVFSSRLTNISADGLSWTLTINQSGAGIGATLSLSTSNGMLTAGSLFWFEQGPHSWNTQEILYSNLTGTAIDPPDAVTPLPNYLTPICQRPCAASTHTEEKTKKRSL